MSCDFCKTIKIKNFFFKKKQDKSCIAILRIENNELTINIWLQDDLGYGWNNLQVWGLRGADVG